MDSVQTPDSDPNVLLYSVEWNGEPDYYKNGNLKGIFFDLSYVGHDTDSSARICKSSRDENETFVDELEFVYDLTCLNVS